MSPHRIIGIVVLIVGIVLFSVGLNASHSVADRANNFWSGRFTEATTWYIVSGIGVSILGLLIAVFAGRTKSD